MAKIHTETLVITVSKLVKESDSVNAIVTDDIVLALTEVAEQVVQELVGDTVIVEVEKA